MPLNRPTQAQLLQAVTEYLRIPVSELGDSKADQFFRRVSANVLAIVERESQLGRDFEQLEQELLQSLVDAEPEQANAALCVAIDSGQQPINLELVSQLQAISREKLKIDNPKYLA